LNRLPAERGDGNKKGASAKDVLARSLAVRTSTTGRHFLQSAWMARRVYGRIGKPGRRFLLSSSYAREMATSWYRGEDLPLRAVLRLGGAEV